MSTFVYVVGWGHPENDSIVPLAAFETLRLARRYTHEECSAWPAVRAIVGWYDPEFDTATPGGQSICITRVKIYDPDYGGGWRGRGVATP